MSSYKVTFDGKEYTFFKGIEGDVCFFCKRSLKDTYFKVIAIKKEFRDCCYDCFLKEKYKQKKENELY